MKKKTGQKCPVFLSSLFMLYSIDVIVCAAHIDNSPVSIGSAENKGVCELLFT